MSNDDFDKIGRKAAKAVLVKMIDYCSAETMFADDCNMIVDIGGFAESYGIKLPKAYRKKVREARRHECDI